MYKMNKIHLGAAFLTAAAVIIAILCFTGSPKHSTAQETAAALAEYEEKMDSFSDAIDYDVYLRQFDRSRRPEREYVIWAKDYVRTENMKAALMENYQGMEGSSVLTDESGLIEYRVNIEEEGFYELSLVYYPVEGKGASIQRAIFVDGELPYSQMSKIEFSRIWKNKSSVWEVDNQGNDIKPEQVEAPEWITGYCYDNDGYVTDRLSVYLSQGEHVLTLVSQKEPMLLHKIILNNSREPQEYSRVMEEGARENKKDSSGQLVTIEAEMADRKSSQMLYPVQDKSSPAVTPSSAKVLQNNTIGGNSWRSVGQWLEWDFEVAESGYYQIGMHIKQNFVKGTYISRKITIDGELPFEEMSSYPFRFKANWHQKVLSDAGGDPYKFYLEAGKHTIRMETVLGDFSAIIGAVENIQGKLNTIYRKVIRITGVAPDLYRDYQIERSLPGLSEETEKAAKELDAIIDELQRVAGARSDREAVLLTMRDQLYTLAGDVELFSKLISSYKVNMSAVGTWITQVISQPLQLDSIYVYSPDQEMPKLKASFFSQLVYEIKSLYYSFIVDYNQIGNVAENSSDNEILTIWVGTGRDQANVIKALIDETFTKETGIGVNVMLVDMNTLLQATLAGQGPDVAMQVNYDLPMNYGVRNALYDLSGFEDLSVVKSRFHDSAMVPFEFEGKTFALPETQTFPMMFYRKDILKELNLEVPRTWEEMKSALSVLSDNQMELGMLPTEPVYSMLLYQNGGQYYKNNATASALDEDVAINVFKNFCNYYTRYKLDRETSVEQRFRTGETPIIIADYTTYNNFQVSAPDIKGLWSFTGVPGTVRKDGQVDNTVTSTGSAVIMLKNCKNPKDAWRYMKWWTSAEIQTAYGKEMESLMGASARYPTANKEAFQNLPWSVSEYEILNQQFEHVVGLEQVPGGYFTWRNVYNAFYRVVIKKTSPRETMTDYVRYINAEITKKRTKLGLGMTWDAD